MEGFLRKVHSRNFKNSPLENDGWEECWMSGVYNYQSNTSQEPKEPSHTFVSSQSSELDLDRTLGKQENQKNQR